MKVNFSFEGTADEARVLRDLVESQEAGAWEEAGPSLAAQLVPALMQALPMLAKLLSGVTVGMVQTSTPEAISEPEPEPSPEPGSEPSPEPETSPEPAPGESEVTAPYGTAEHMMQVELLNRQQQERAKATKLRQISPELRRKAWAYFKATLAEWLVGFEVEDAPQPDRIRLIQEMGSGLWPMPILVMAHELGSLQALVEKVMSEDPALFGVPDPAFIERVAGHMVQLSHLGFPDLSGVMDYNWLRKKKETA